MICPLQRTWCDFSVSLSNYRAVASTATVSHLTRPARLSARSHHVISLILTTNTCRPSTLKPYCDHLPKIEFHQLGRNQLQRVYCFHDRNAAKGKTPTPNSNRKHRMNHQHRHTTPLSLPPLPEHIHNPPPSLLPLTDPHRTKQQPPQQQPKIARPSAAPGPVVASS